MNTLSLKTISSKTKMSVKALFLSLAILLASCGDGTSTRNLDIPGVNGPSVVLLGDNILIDVVFENLIIEGGGRFPIPKYVNSYMEISPDLESNGTLVSFSVSLDDIFGGVNQLDPLSLPGGRPIPGVSGGTLPAVAFSVEKLKNVAFYIGPKIFGLWIPLPSYNVAGAILTTRFYTGSTRVGNLSLVGNDENGENSGMFLALTVSSYGAKYLKRVAARN